MSCGTFRHLTSFDHVLNPRLGFLAENRCLQVLAASIFSEMSTKFSFKNTRPRFFSFCCLFTYVIALWDRKDSCGKRCARKKKNQPREHLLKTFENIFATDWVQIV